MKEVNPSFLSSKGILLLLIFAVASAILTCQHRHKIPLQVAENQKIPQQFPFLIILGIAQDAGYPQANCKKDCCKNAWRDARLRRSPACLALVEPVSGSAWMLEATPDIKDQLQNLTHFGQPELKGIFLTHAHIGHYSGLMQLGREVMGAKKMPVYAMPGMKTFLENNGPWSQLVHLQNIDIQPLEAEKPVKIQDKISITPILVPHRDEYSETVGFKIEGPNKSALFIPDIDKWGLWNRDILEEIRKVDYAFLDGTFFQNGELPGRDMSEIPHPFITESMDLFSKLPHSEKAKIYFIHFNHTNPVLQEGHRAKSEVEKAGFKIAEEEMVLGM